MILFKNKESLPSKQLCNFLHEEFGLNQNAINLAIKHSQLESAPFPIILRNFGLISLSQYEELLDWIIKNE